MGPDCIIHVEQDHEQNRTEYQLSVSYSSTNSGGDDCDGDDDDDVTSLSGDDILSRNDKYLLCFQSSAGLSF